MSQHGLNKARLREVSRKLCGLAMVIDQIADTGHQEDFERIVASALGDDDDRAPARVVAQVEAAALVKVGGDVVETGQELLRLGNAIR